MGSECLIVSNKGVVKSENGDGYERILIPLGWVSLRPEHSGS